MDNVKTDSYYIEKIRKDLEFIVEHMRNVDMEELKYDIPELLELLSE